MHSVEEPHSKLTHYLRRDPALRRIVRAKEQCVPTAGSVEGHWESWMPTERSVGCWSSPSQLTLRPARRSLGRRARRRSHTADGRCSPCLVTDAIARGTPRHQTSYDLRPITKCRLPQTRETAAPCSLRSAAIRGAVFRERLGRSSAQSTSQHQGHHTCPTTRRLAVPAEPS